MKIKRNYDGRTNTPLKKQVMIWDKNQSDMKYSEMISKIFDRSRSSRAFALSLGYRLLVVKLTQCLVSHLL